MPEITKRRVGELQRGVFKILLDQPEGLRAKEILARMEREVPPTEFEKMSYPRNPEMRRFEKMIRFSTIGPVKAGWLVKNQGCWFATEEGKKAYAEFPEPEKFAREADRLFREWRATEAAVPPVEGDATEAAATVEQAEETAWTEIENYVRAMNPYDVQKLIAALLRAMGYHVCWEAAPGPDRGIDIVAHNDPLGTSGPRIKVQVKRTADAVGAPDLRSFIAVLGEQDVGIFVSIGGFSKDAEEEARTKETRKLTLIDLKQLMDLWIEHYGKVDQGERRLLPIRPVYYLDLRE